MTEDQVVVGDEVEEPDVQLLCIVALRIKQTQTSCQITAILLIINAFQQINMRPWATASKNIKLASEKRTLHWAFF